MENEWIAVVDGKRPELPAHWTMNMLLEVEARPGFSSYSRPVLLSRLVSSYAWNWLLRVREAGVISLATPAKAEREPSAAASCKVCQKCHAQNFLWRTECLGCGRLFLDMYIGDNEDTKPAPRWVRCDDRLPSPGVYSFRFCGRPSDIETRHFNGAQWSFACDLEDHQWGFGLSKNYEWLDEAPAREGQRESAADNHLSAQAGRAEGGNTSAQQGVPAQSDSHQHGYRGRAREQAQDHADLMTLKQDFWRTIGRGKR